MTYHNMALPIFLEKLIVNSLTGSWSAKIWLYNLLLSSNEYN